MRYLSGRRGQRFVHGMRLLTRIRVETLLHVRGIARYASRTDVRIWVDGVEAFPRIEELLRSARHTIVIQTFIWKDDAAGRQMASVLLEAAERGVRVDITKEILGDFFESHVDFLSTRVSPDPLWQRFWRHSRIHIHHALHRDHAKVYVIDDRILLLTGMNVADEYRWNWHDYLVELSGHCYVAQYLAGDAESDRGGRIALVMNTERCKQVRPMLRALLAQARKSLVIEHAYLSDPETLDTLARRSHEGLRITVILPQRSDIHHHANLQTIGRLLTQCGPNLRVLLYPGMVHGKIILVDRATAFLGSANLMASSLDDMGEVNVVLRGKHTHALRRLRSTLRADILKSRPVAQQPGSLWLSRILALIGL